jgi:polyisoprenoid-binding protein YceI
VYSEEHLKSTDFFDTSTYPTAEFRIKEMVPHADAAQTFTYDLTADFTLRNITNEITVPIVLQKEGDGLVARAQFDIDRTAWGITLDSSAYFPNSGDDALDEHITITLQLVTQPIPSPDIQHADTENASSTI